MNRVVAGGIALGVVVVGAAIFVALRSTGGEPSRREGVESAAENVQAGAPRPGPKLRTLPPRRPGMLVEPAAPFEAPSFVASHPELAGLPQADRDALDAYFALTSLDPQVPEGMPADAEDREHRNAFMEKSSRMGPIVASLRENAGHPDLRVPAFLALSQVHADMADFLRSAPAPAHLSSEQADAYADAMELKAQQQLDQASAALDELEAIDPDAAAKVAWAREMLEGR
ncbi:MAG: hypothetical protein R3F61_24275 [Myxococcota bacterium]